MTTTASGIESLAKLQAAIRDNQPLPSEVATWIVRLAMDSLGCGERVKQRNHYLRAAADLMTGSVEAKATQLQREVLALQRCWARRQHESPNLQTPRGCVHAALRWDEAPTSRIQLRRILTARGPTPSVDDFLSPQDSKR